MLKAKEEKIATTIHLNRSQFEKIDRLARRTRQSRAYILRELVDSGLAVANEKEMTGAAEEERHMALQRLLRMGDGYGASGKKTIERLDEELYGK